MSADPQVPSARREELLELAYAYVLRNGMAAMSLRPLAEAVGSSPRVLLYLFGSKDGLVRALLGRSRTEELALLARVRAEGGGPAEVIEGLWGWLAAPQRRDLLRLWAEGYARSLVEPDGPWAGFAAQGVQDWIEVLGGVLGPKGDPTEVLATLRGALLDLLATGDVERTTVAVRRTLARM
ncbi:TetR family transcriptional regulator [Pseudonocardia sp. DSM 110487]|uniref:TetR family transcriptional regulator n=1 Tax=Pseudonocardia sp. DSM 110487 TaxID=2865833 RepID=UPI001C6A12DC|nr:TetR family transcriptional regulator [Pseudonocardia sp. DSM 110487]QYN34191.1 TetR family transcriptional regulator [Pseudonocardia sp. DSM 110487]